MRKVRYCVLCCVFFCLVAAVAQAGNKSKELSIAAIKSPATRSINGQVQRSVQYL